MKRKQLESYRAREKKNLLWFFSPLAYHSRKNPPFFKKNYIFSPCTETVQFEEPKGRFAKFSHQTHFPTH